MNRWRNQLTSLVATLLVGAAAGSYFSFAPSLSSAQKMLSDVKIIAFSIFGDVTVNENPVQPPAIAQVQPTPQPVVVPEVSPTPAPVTKVDKPQAPRQARNTQSAAPCDENIYDCGGGDEEDEEEDEDLPADPDLSPQIIIEQEIIVRISDGVM